MRTWRIAVALVFLPILLLSTFVSAQTATPRLIRFSGVVKNDSGSAVVGITFSLYKEQTGGASLWLETQNVTVDRSGRYTVLLGADHGEGVPLDLFANGEARWLGVKPDQQEELPRVLLVSVPYALKAADADTLGGKPLSSFVLVRQDDKGDTGSGGGSTQGAAAVVANAISGGGSINFVPVFTDSSGTLGNSSISQGASGNIGIGFENPNSRLVIGAPSGGGVLNASNLSDQDMLIVLSAPGATDKYTYFGTSTPTNLMLGVGGKEKMRISSTGNVGIGFSDPKSRLVIGAPNGGGVLNASNLADQDMQIVLSAPGAGDKSTYFGTSTPTNLTLGVGASEKMRITNSGRVGIGTNSPTNALTVAGTVESLVGGFKFPNGTTQSTAFNPSVIGGGLTSVTSVSGSGVSASATGGAVSLSTDPAILQKRVTGSCPTGAIAQVNQDGSVVCSSVAGPGSPNPSMYLVLRGTGLEDTGAVGVPAARLHTDQAIAVTNVSYNAISPGKGSCTPGIVRISNGTIYEDFSIAVGASAYTTTDHALIFPAGSDITISLNRAADCGGDWQNSPPEEIGGSVRYRLSNAGEATSCPAALTLVGGSCVDFNYDPANCGGSGKTCSMFPNMNASCTKGSCGLGSCRQGFGNCDGASINGCEANLQNDPNNCGWCGSACPAIGPVANGIAGCFSGGCNVSCNAGWASCYGNSACTTNITSDPNNCGTCGYACGAGQACVSSKCVSSGNSSPINITVNPSSVTVGVNGSVSFSALVMNTSNTAVYWSVQEAGGGAVSALGAYGAPASAGTYHVKATSQVDPSSSATATVTVAAVSAAPPTFTSKPPVSAFSGQSYTYAVTATDPASTGVTYELLESPLSATLSGNSLSWYPNSYPQRRFLGRFTILAKTGAGGVASQSWVVNVGGVIAGTRRYTYVPESGPSVTVPENLSVGSPYVIATNPDGTSTTIYGDGSTSGTFSVSNVPAGEYLLRYGSYSHVTGSDTFDLSYDTQGRVDGQTASSGTYLSTTFTGLNPTQASDSIQVYIPNLGCWTARPVPIGVSGFTDNIPWSTPGGWTCSLLDASKDNLYFLQHVTTRISGKDVQVAKKYSGPLHVTMSNLGTQSVSSPMTDLTLNKVVRANLKGASFAALLTAVNPSASSTYSDFAVSAISDASERGFYGASGDFLESYNAPPLSSDLDLGDVQYGNPFSNTITFAQYVQQSKMSYIAPGATSAKDFFGYIAVYTTKLPTASEGIAPLVSPVVNARIQGTTLFSAQTINTRSPLLTWDAPAVGTATAYYVSVTGLTNSSGATVQSSFQGFYTTKNSLQLPVGTLLAGGTYCFRIRAYYMPGTYFPQAPYRQSWPTAYADMLSAPVSVSSTPTGIAGDLESHDVEVQNTPAPVLMMEAEPRVPAALQTSEHVSR
jgi:hypothetical protein